MKDKVIKRLLWIVGIIFIVGYILGFIIPYGLNLGSFSNDHYAWSSFGSYYGGVLSPLFSFLSFLAILLIFREEMKLKRAELEQSKSDLKEEKEKQYLKEEEQIIWKYLELLSYQLQKANLIKENRDKNENGDTFQIVLKQAFKIVAFLDEHQKVRNINEVTFKYIVNIYNKYFDYLVQLTAFVKLHIYVYSYIKKSPLRKVYLPIYETTIDIYIIQTIILSSGKLIKNTTDPYIVYLKSLHKEGVEAMIDAQKKIGHGWFKIERIGAQRGWETENVFYKQK